jgi:hypothetical protein
MAKRLNERIAELGLTPMVPSTEMSRTSELECPAMTQCGPWVRSATRRLGGPPWTKGLGNSLDIVACDTP